MTSTSASACGGSAQGNSSAVPWSTAWRAVASPHLPRSGVLPWLILHPSGGHKTERVYCPEESVALPPLHLPGEAVHRLAPLSPVGRIRGLNGNDRLMDIAFCNGELYGITRDSKRLIKYEFGVNHLEELDVNIRSLCMLNNYKNGQDEHVSFTAIGKNNFTVFELVHSHRRNDKIPNGVKVFLKSLNDDGYQVYYKKDESVMDGMKGIMSTGYYAMGGVHPPMWLFPKRCAED
uniref:DUF295 domain-containing protein n=1 Tax=Aegilops tauschii TaxID=37682 RepID=M8CHU3_AEGTA